MSMRPITPEELDSAKLPRAAMGYRTDATEDLLRRVAWELRELLHTEKRLTETNAQLTRTVEELEQRVAKLQADLDARNDREGLIGETLAQTQRAAREAREAAKRDCERMIKKARVHAAKVTAEAERRRVSLGEQIRELEATHSRTREELRAFLLASLAPLESAEQKSAGVDEELHDRAAALAAHAGEDAGQQ